MKTLTFWFDPISPYTYLAFEHLPQALEGCSYVVDYRPVLFAGLLGHWGQLGPAEIEPKRAWTFRHVHWLAHRHGIALDTPAQHPSNPLALLRLAWACAPEGGTPNRLAVETLLRHVWVGGDDANDPGRLAALRQQLVLQRDPAAPEVKADLRQATDDAVQRGLFGVPAFELDGRLFWGFDALDMLAGALRGSTTVSEPTRKRIEAIARQLNYTVDKNASSLRRQTTNTLALLFFEDPTPDASMINPFFLSMLGSITRTCALRGYDLLMPTQQFRAYE